MMITELFEEAVARKASDIHLATGEAPCLRISGDLIRLEKPALDRESMMDLLSPVVPQDSWARIHSGLSVDRSVHHGDLNFSLIVFRSADDGLAATFRIIPAEIPGLDIIGEGAPELMDIILKARRGLVLIAGPVMSGKGTSAASLLDAINATVAARIFVIDTSPSYGYKSKLGMVTQLRVGFDFDNYERALETAHLADPDVIYVNDIPTAEALRQTMILAETGHLVIANLHADSVTDVFKRLFHAAGGDAAALHEALAQSLIVVSVQRLFRRLDGTSRVPAYEWLSNTSAVKQALLAGDLGRIAELQRIEPESRSLDAALDQLVQSGNISDDMALPHRDRVL